MLAEILAEVTPGLSKQDGLEESVTAAVMKAYLHRPTRELLKKLWSTYSQQSVDAAPFLHLVDKIAEAAVPEALSAAVTFAQKAYALSVLLDMQHKGTEPDLQKLIQTFPWILQPGMEKLTANQTLKTMVQEAAKRGFSPSRTDLSRIDVNEKYKPDFVFLNDLDDTHFVVVEIKSPREDLTLRNREQLAAYMVYLEQQYPDAKREGLLVGANGKGLPPSRTDIKIMPWADVVARSRRAHVELLAAMLKTANPERDDDRLRQILEFGGTEVWEILERIAANDEILGDLVQDRPKL